MAKMTDEQYRRRCPLQSKQVPGYCTASSLRNVRCHEQKSCPWFRMRKQMEDVLYKADHYRVPRLASTDFRVCLDSNGDFDTKAVGQFHLLARKAVNKHFANKRFKYFINECYRLILDKELFKKPTDHAED